MFHEWLCFSLGECFRSLLGKAYLLAAISVFSNKSSTLDIRNADSVLESIFHGVVTLSSTLPDSFGSLRHITFTFAPLLWHYNHTNRGILLQKSSTEIFKEDLMHSLSNSVVCYVTLHDAVEEWRKYLSITWLLNTSLFIRFEQE